MEVLNHQQVADRITRIAWQIYENHQDEKKIILAGIVEHGYTFARHITKELRKISPLEIEVLRLKINKKDPLAAEAVLDGKKPELENQSIVLVDDVLNTGSTLIYGVKFFLNHHIRQIKTVVLVDRNHKSFPVKADFKGLSLSTNMMEHVEVNIDKKPYSVTVS